MGYVGIDLDGTLAHYDGWVSEEHIGEPIASTVRLVQHLLANRKDVRIFTARVARKSGKDLECTERFIDMWCIRHLGRTLPITCVKDYEMEIYYDDRCVQMITNTGRRADGESLT